MSSVGGTRLGMAGTQVNLTSGVPVLPKDVTARSWIVSDAESGAVLASHNAHWRLPPASTLKMLFADTVLPKFPRTTEHKVVASDLAGMVRELVKDARKLKATPSAPAWTGKKS